MIDQATIDRIFAAIDIVEIISDFVSLKKAGTNYRGHSPFTEEKTPSFFVSPSKQIYKCFSSGKGGNAIGFIMEHEKFSYPEALKYAAKKYNIEIVEKELSPEDKEKVTVRDSMLVVSNWAQTYFTDNLLKHEEGKAIGLSYFKERGFREDIITKFQLGYGLEQRDALTQAATKAGYKLDFLVSTGLTIKKEDGYTFDRFAGRVMFPIHSLSGQVIGFGGRTLKSTDKTAKYLNSPESEIYHKSNVLYGLYLAKTAIVKNDLCYMVEGYTDVISLHQNGIENVVASSGTALTAGQIKLIKRFTPNITILYDGDPAGIKASLRGIDLILEEGMNVKVLLLPDGEDPDSYAQKHSASDFTKYITENAEDFISFKTKLLASDAKKDPVKRANLIQDIVRSISVIPDRIVRSVYVSQCASLLEIDEQILNSEVYKNRREKAGSSFPKKAQAQKEIPHTSTPVPGFVSEIYIEKTEKEIVRFLMLYGHLNLFRLEDEQGFITVAEYIINEILNDDLEFSNLNYKKIFTEYREKLNAAEQIDSNYFTHHPDSEINSLAADLLSSRYELSKIHERKGVHIATEEMQLRKMVPETLINYKIKVLQIAQKEKENQLKEAQNNNTPPEKMVEIMTQYQQIKNVLMTIFDQQGTVITG